MADIARLGFEARTDDLDKAKSKLEALVPAAKGAAAAANSVNTGLKAVAGGAQSFTGGVQRAAAGATGLNKATLMASTGMRTVQSAAAGAMGPLNALGGTVTRIGLNFAQADAHVEAYKRSLLTVPAAAGGAKSALDRLGMAANDNINRLQSTPGNIAAQFQDIGVTAAAGMSPFLIALQQGTQLSSAMAGGVGNLLAGFAQLFSMTTILTIGLVGLAAAGLQMVDWMGLAKSGMYLLADGLEAVADMAMYLGGVLLIAFGPQIIAAIWGVSRAIIAGYFNAMAKAVEISILFALANPWSAFIIGVGLAVAAIAFFARDFEIMGHNVIDTTKNAANWLINSFVGAYKGVKAAWSQLPAAMGDVVYQVVNRVIKGAEAMVNGSITLMNSMIEKLPFGIGDGLLMGGVSFGGVNNPFAGAADGFNDVVNGAIRAEQGIDRVGQAADWAAGKFGDLAAWLRNTADGMGKVDDEIKKSAARKAPKAPKTDAEKFAEIVAGVNKEIAALQMETTALGMSTEAAMQYRKEHEMVQAALDAGIVITEGMAKEILRLAEAWTKAQQTFNHAKFMTDMAKAHEEVMWSLERQRAELGLTGTALEAHRLETELLTAARRANIDLTPDDIAALKRYAKEQALVTDMIRRQREQIEEMRATARGFFRDWFDGIMQGKNIFASFADAVINGLQRIASKMMDRAIDKFLDMMFNPWMFGGGGPSAALVADASATISANPDLFAKGGAFDGIRSFAKGGAFTNTIVSQPTLFRYAKGAGFGEMGEAGPEAIMPLKRGPDGSLGVQAAGAGRSVVIHAPITVHNDNRVTGAVSSQDIVAMQRAQSEQTKREIERAIPEIINSYQRDGARV